MLKAQRSEALKALRTRRQKRRGGEVRYITILVLLKCNHNALSVSFFEIELTTIGVRKLE